VFSRVCSGLPYRLGGSGSVMLMSLHSHLFLTRMRYSYLLLKWALVQHAC
jgi:hypothetical protein